MKNKGLAIIGIALFALSQPVSAGIYDGLDEHGNKQVSGQYSFDVFVPCLNGGASDFLSADVDYHLVVSRHSARPKPAVRLAVYSMAGNDPKRT